MIVELFIAVIIGICFDRAQMIISAFNYESLYNGFGAVELTVKRNIKAPMAYRVLVPYLVVWIEKLFKTSERMRVIIYQHIKTLLVIFAAWAVIHSFGYLVAGITFIILVATIQFDYWDWPIELAAISLAAGGFFIPALFAGILFALTRETAPITGVIYLAMTGDWIGAIIITSVIGLIMLTVRLYVGKRELYCKRVMLKENYASLKDFFKYKPIYFSPIFVTSAIVIGTVVSVIVNPQYWYSLVLLGAGLVLAKADEPRIFSAIIPFIAVAIGGLI